MILNDEKSFDTVVETYGGFPLKKDFLDAGNAAIQKFGVKAELKNGMVRIPYISRSLDEEELQDYVGEELEEARKWRIEAMALIEVKNPSEGITDAGLECIIADFEEFEGVIDDECDLYQDEYDLGVEIVEAFLNVALDCD